MNPNSSGKSSHPLRPYYQPPDDSTFIASAPPKFNNSSPSSGSGSSTRIGSSASTPSSSSPTPNKYVANDLYSQNYSNKPTAGSGSGSSITDLASAALTSLALQYTSTCLAMPFEVGKLLLQVQWVPTDQVWKSHAQTIRARARLNKKNQAKREREERRRIRLERRSNLGRIRELSQRDGNDSAIDEVEEEEEEEEEEELDPFDDDQERHELAPEAEEWQDEQQGRNRSRNFGVADEFSDSDEAEAYFRDLSSQSQRPAGSSSFPSRKTKRSTDESGYMIRRNLKDETEGTKPEFVMPVVVKGGVWEMMKAVGRGKEGWFGLFKGTFTTFLLDNSFNTIQPLLSGFFSLFTTTSSISRNFNLSIAYSPYPFKSLTILLSSHLLTGILLSPLDLIRTRLVAQSTLSSHRKYKGPLNALKQILNAEGGWRTIYFHPNLLIPTILDYTFRPLFNLSIPLIIEYWLHVEPNLNPITYALVELILSSAGLLITLPIETVRRRLQLQLRAPWGKTPDLKTPINSSNNQTATSAPETTSVPLKNQLNQSGLGTTKPPSVIVKPEIDYEKRPLRTCIETRPEPYAGVVEAIYKILTEETSLSHRSSPPNATSTSTSTSSSGDQSGAQESRRKRNESTDSNSSINNLMSRSGIIAKTGNSSLGGLNSLYRGLTMALSANLVVFVLTLVGGERAGASGGWAEI